MQDIRTINELVQKNYIEKGILRAESDDSYDFHDEMHNQNDANIIVAKNKSGEIIGTISYTLLNSKNQIRSSHKDKINELIESGNTIMLLWRYFIDNSYNSSLSKKLFLTIFRELLILKVPQKIILLNLIENRSLLNNYNKVVDMYSLSNHDLFKDCHSILIKVEKTDIFNNELLIKSNSENILSTTL